MPVFRGDVLTEIDADGQSRERLDWQVMKRGQLALFRKDAVLADAIVWLERHGYVVAQADCGACATEDDVVWTIGQALGFELGLRAKLPDGSLTLRERCWTFSLGCPGTTSCSVGGS